MLSDPHLVVAKLLGELEEAKIVLEALHHAGKIWDLAQAEDPKLRLGHALPPRRFFEHIFDEPWAAVKPRQRHRRPPALAAGLSTPRVRGHLAGSIVLAP